VLSIEKYGIFYETVPVRGFPCFSLNFDLDIWVILCVLALM